MIGTNIDQQLDKYKKTGLIWTVSLWIYC